MTKPKGFQDNEFRLGDSWPAGRRVLGVRRGISATPLTLTVNRLDGVWTRVQRRAPHSRGRQPFFAAWKAAKLVFLWPRRWGRSKQVVSLIRSVRQSWIATLRSAEAVHHHHLRLWRQILPVGLSRAISGASGIVGTNQIRRGAPLRKAWSVSAATLRVTCIPGNVGARGISGPMTETRLLGPRVEREIAVPHGKRTPEFASTGHVGAPSLIFTNPTWLSGSMPLASWDHRGDFAAPRTATVLIPRRENNLPAGGATRSGRPGKLLYTGLGRVADQADRAGEVLALRLSPLDRLVHRVGTASTSGRSAIDRAALSMASVLRNGHLVHVNPTTPSNPGSPLLAAPGERRQKTGPSSSGRPLGDAKSWPSSRPPQGISTREERELTSVERYEIVREVVNTLEDQLLLEQQRRGLGI